MFKGITGFFIRKNEDGGKKKPSPLENLVIIVVLGVIIILAGGFFTRSSDTEDTFGNKSGNSSSGSSGVASLTETGYNGQEVVSDIEKRLSELLSNVQGAGVVSVMVYADTSSEVVPAYNNQQETREDATNGGTSSQLSENKELALSGDDTPVVLKVIIPQIRGVVVVAEGADDLLVKEQLNNAVCTLLGIPEHRVQILKHK